MNYYTGDGARYYGEDADDYGHYFGESEPYYSEEEDYGTPFYDELQYASPGYDVPAFYPEEENFDYAAGIYATIPADEVSDMTEGLRQVLHESYESASPEELQETLQHVLGTMTPAEGFDFSRTLRDIGRAGQAVLSDPTATQIAQVALPIAGAAIGTAAGGPVGTVIGGGLGTVAASAFTGGTTPAAAPGQPAQATPVHAAPARPAPRPAPPTRPAAPVRPLPPPAVVAPPAIPPPYPAPAAPGSSAATQVMALAQNPAVISALLSLIMGTQGTGTVPVAATGESIPVLDVVRTLGVLAGKAAREAEALHAESDSGFSEARAGAIYQALTGA